jgi:putative endonuclease
MCLSSFPPSTPLNNKKPRDAECHPERSEGSHNFMKAFYVYMMTNRSRVVLYTGITNSLMRRVWQHQNGEIGGFTKSYKVDRLVYYERFNDPRDAIAREKEIKAWRRAKKNALVETMNPKWADLSPMLFQHTRVIPNEVRDPT